MKEENMGWPALHVSESQVLIANAAASFRKRLEAKLEISQILLPVVFADSKALGIKGDRGRPEMITQI